jgi:flagellar hook-associated protein 1 FlgK
MSGILGTALSGLMAFQRALDTTSNNIANVNTEGYSRQRVDISSNQSFFSEGHFFGQGVNVAAVSRSYDSFVTSQLAASTSAFGESNTLATMTARLDSAVSSEASNLAPALKSFFNSVHGVAGDPTSVAARQSMAVETESLSAQFNQMATKFENLHKESNRVMEGTVDDINLYAQNLAEVNGKISLEASRNRGNETPNELLDMRDNLINKIAEKVSVTTLQQENGTVDVFIGKGQSLVLGKSAAKLSLEDSSLMPGRKEITLGGQNITKSVSGGELAGAVKFRDQILAPAQQQLGLVATGLAVQFNALHSTGFDLNGDPGSNLFSFGTPAMDIPINAKTGSVGSISATYDAASIGQLAASDYELSYDGSQFSLKRLSDNSVTTYAGAPPSTISGPGFSITTDANVTANDSFLIRPTYNAAEKFSAVINDPDKIAAAGTVGSTGEPNPGDNTVALALADLENKTALSGGKTTISGAYSQLSKQIGVQTHSAKVGNSAQEALLNQATLERESLAGVNLDEEAANLIKYQQSYQAAAQVVSIANSIFDTLIGALRR